MEGQIPYTPETPSQSTAIHFEPAYHPLTPEEYQTVGKAFLRGDLDAYLWNKEVGERIASYSYDAPTLVMGIDGLSVWSRKDELSLGEAQNLWVHLPARPNKLNYTGVVYVLRGEAFGNLMIMQPNLKEIPKSIAQQASAKFEADKNAVGTNLEYQLGGESVAIGLGILTAMGMKIAVANYKKQPPQKAQSSTAAKNTMSRRQFLKRSFQVGAGAIGAAELMSSPLLQRIPAFEAAYAPTEQTMELWQTIDTIVSPKFIRSIWLDGRTALLMAKTEDSSGNVLVMGYGHDDMAQRFRDKTERAKAIRAYTEDILDIGKHLYAGCFGISPEKVPASAINNLLTYVSHVDIFQVTDPGGSSIQPHFPNMVDKQIALHKSFISPQVEEAIKDFRQNS